MKQAFKDILKRLNIYHPLQGFYRTAIFLYKRNGYRKDYDLYKGSGFTCNVCSNRYQKFVPDFPAAENREAIKNYQVVAGYGDNIYCPFCMSTARDRLVLAKLSERDLIKKNILHLSPEKNIYNFIRNKANVITADLLPGFYRTIDGMVQKQDATQFSFADASFDWVIGNHILEHIPDDVKAMKEIFRVLKPGGRAVLQVPYSEILTSTIEDVRLNDPVKQSQLFGQKDHVRIYSLGDYTSRLKNAGFAVEIIPYAALQQYYPFAIQQGECFLEINKPQKSVDYKEESL